MAVFLSRACVSADAAAVFAGLGDFGFLSTLPAAEAAFFDVVSFLAFRRLSQRSQCVGTVIGRPPVRINSVPT